MTTEKQAALEAAGWRFGTAAEFLGLSEEESIEVERRAEEHMERRKSGRAAASLGDAAAEFNARVEPQSAPTPNDSRPIWDLVVADMRERDKLGRRVYGTPLQAHNGRDALRDAYEEALDLAVYLRQVIEERDSPREATGR